MAEWWQYGYSIGKENCPDCKIIDAPEIAKVVAAAVEHSK
jgi:hypothetical protein